MIHIDKTDTFHAVAQRVYENEVSMLVEAIDKLDTGNTTMMYPENYELHKRMPEIIEEKLIESFEEFRRTQNEICINRLRQNINKSHKGCSQ